MRAFGGGVYAALCALEASGFVVDILEVFEER